MDHLAQDLTIALQESESCGSAVKNVGKWGFRRRTRSAGNLQIYVDKYLDNYSDDNSSSFSELKFDHHQSNNSKATSFYQSDSDDLILSAAVTKALSQKNSLRMKHPLRGFLKGVNHSLESDSFNEHSPASRRSLRRKRKFKRMSIDDTPIPPTGKRKRSQRMEIDNGKFLKFSCQIKPLHHSVVDKIEKFCQPSPQEDDENVMKISEVSEETYDKVSDSSISWSGGEGHEGDDELTDWAPPPMESSSSTAMDTSTMWYDDQREIRVGCRRLGDERPGFSILTGVNDRVAKFLQDSTKFELRVFGVDREKLSKLASLYSLHLCYEAPTTALLRKTNNTPSMQPPTQRHHHHHHHGSVHWKRRKNHTN